MSTPTASASLRLNSWEISNFLRIESQTVDADGRHVILSGPNGSGKTSSIDAIWLALGGKRAVAEPIRRGEDEARVRLDLGAYIVERIWTEKGTKLAVMAADGSKITHAAKLIDGFLADYALNPVLFIQQRPQDQLDVVLSIAGVTPPEDAVENILGEPFPAEHDESAYSYLMRLAADKTGVLFVQRKDLGQQLERKNAALAEQTRILQALGGKVREDERTIDPQTVVDRMAVLNIQKDARNAKLAELEQATRYHEDVTGQFKTLQTQLATTEAEIARLQAELEKATATKAKLQERLAKGEKVIAEWAGERDALAAELAALPDPNPEIQQLTAQNRASAEQRKEVQARLQAQESLARLRHERDELQKRHKERDDQLAAVRDLRRNLLNGADLGVPELEIGDGELRYRGVPFAQASQAEALRVACAVAMKQNPKLKLMRIDQGEQLDATSRRLVFELADTHGWQVILTTVADTEALRVEIVEGGSHA